MRELVHKRYLRNKRIRQLVDKLESLTLAARMRQENFFDLNLNAFKKKMGRC
ncbi:MAG: hypothetical protein V1927_06255 [Candidatus Omnitrophota bacterium]